MKRAHSAQRRRRVFLGALGQTLYSGAAELNPHRLGTIIPESIVYLDSVLLGVPMLWTAASLLIQKLQSSLLRE